MTWSNQIFHATTETHSSSCDTTSGFRVLHKIIIVVCRYFFLSISFMSVDDGMFFLCRFCPPTGNCQLCRVCECVGSVDVVSHSIINFTAVLYVNGLCQFVTKLINRAIPPLTTSRDFISVSLTCRIRSMNHSFMTRDRCRLHIHVLTLEFHMWTSKQLNSLSNVSHSHKTCKLNFN